MRPEIQNEKQKTAKGIFPYIAATIVGTTGAAIAATATIFDRFNRDLKVTRALGHINKPYIEDLEKLNADFFTHKTIDAVELCKKTGDRKIKHAENIAKELANRGFPNGLEGVKLRYMQLSPKSKNTMYINAIITAAIGFGGTFSFLTSMQSRGQLKALLDEKSNLGSSAER